MIDKIPLGPLWDMLQYIKASNSIFLTLISNCSNFSDKSILGLLSILSGLVITFIFPSFILLISTSDGNVLSIKIDCKTFINSVFFSTILGLIICMLCFVNSSFSRILFAI